MTGVRTTENKTVATTSISTAKRIEAAVDRLWLDLLDGRSARNQEVWDDGRNWHFGLYYGAGDTRLWVPARKGWRAQDRDERVINFCHPAARKAYFVLMTGYLIGAVSLLLVVAAFSGQLGAL